MVFERKVLRKIFDPTKERDVIWRIKTNDVLDKLIRHKNMINNVKAKRFSPFGHLHRISEERKVKKKINRSRFNNIIRRTKNRWEDDKKRHEETENKELD